MRPQNNVVLAFGPMVAYCQLQARPGLAAHSGHTLVRIRVVGLAALFALVMVQEWERLSAAFTEISFAVAVLTVIILGAGCGTVWHSAWGARDRFTLAMVLVVRNVAITSAFALTVLGRTKLVVVATTYFLN